MSLTEALGGVAKFWEPLGSFGRVGEALGGFGRLWYVRKASFGMARTVNRKQRRLPLITMCSCTTPNTSGAVFWCLCFIAWFLVCCLHSQKK